MRKRSTGVLVVALADVFYMETYRRMYHDQKGMFCGVRKWLDNADRDRSQNQELNRLPPQLLDDYLLCRNTSKTTYADKGNTCREVFIWLLTN